MDQDSPGGSANSEESATRFQMLEREPTDWTDEKHNSYLNSIEESFIRQLYNSETGSGKHRKQAGSSSKSSSSGQFKVFHRGCWETINFERARSQVDTEDGTHHILFENPWIHHFSSHMLSDELQRGEYNQVDQNSLAPQAMQTGGSSSMQHESFYHQYYPQNSAEVSDQNFMDDVSQGGKRNRKIRKKDKK